MRCPGRPNLSVLADVMVFMMMIVSVAVPSGTIHGNLQSPHHSLAPANSSLYLTKKYPLRAI